MNEISTEQKDLLLSYTATIVAAYISKNETKLDEIPDVVGRVFGALHKIQKDPSSLGRKNQREPAVPIDQSVTHDYIICLEDGKKLQMLKRHLNTVYKLSLEQYREKWNLPADYPMVSPGYAERRSLIAKSTGLGVTGRRSAKIKIVSSSNQRSA